jgi:hypothetical protein
LKLEKIRSKSTAPIASPASESAWPSRPTTAVSVSPSSGVVMKASVIGTAIDSTSRCVTAKARFLRSPPCMSMSSPESRRIADQLDSTMDQ